PWRKQRRERGGQWANVARCEQLAVPMHRARARMRLRRGRLRTLQRVDAERDQPLLQKPDVARLRGVVAVECIDAHQLAQQRDARGIEPEVAARAGLDDPAVGGRCYALDVALKTLTGQPKSCLHESAPAVRRRRPRDLAMRVAWLRAFARRGCG